MKEKAEVVQHSGLEPGEELDPNLHVQLEDGPFLKLPNVAEGKLRQFSHGGQNYEHVSDTVLGIWVYRAM